MEWGGYSGSAGVFRLHGFSYAGGMHWNHKTASATLVKGKRYILRAIRIAFIKLLLYVVSLLYGGSKTLNRNNYYVCLRVDFNRRYYCRYYRLLYIKS